MLLKDTERWLKLKRIFEHAADLEPAAADAFLKTECAGDEDLLAKARRFLDLHRQSGLALDRGLPGKSLQDLLLPRALQPGQLLAERFRVVRFLGEGGIGEVYEAEDLELGQRLAIKTLHPFGAAEPSTRDRFKREITLARSVSHPNICRIHDFYAGDPAFITMELLEGEVLSERIKREGPLAEASALPILQQLCAGLEEAHRQRIVHRDLKPSNIMLCESRVVIMDFGLALLEGRHDPDGVTIPTSALGTPVYMSPEQLQGSLVTASSDIYSLGVVLFEMLTGAPPHVGISPLAIAARRVQEPPPSPRVVRPTVSERWDLCVRRCLAINPRDRFSSARDLIGAVEPESHPRLQLRMLRRVSAFLYAAAAIGLIAFALLWYGLLDRRPNAEAARWFQLGEKSLEVGSSFAASQLFERARQADNAFAFARIRLAEALIQQDRYERAKDELLQVDLLLARAWPRGRAERTAVEAAKAAAVRDFPAASRLYAQIADNANADARPHALLALAEARRRAGDLEPALQAATEAAVLNPQLAPAWLSKGTLESALSRYPAADESFRRARELFDLQKDIEGEVEVLRAHAAALTASQHLDQALAELRGAEALAEGLGSPATTARVQFSLSSVHRQRGEGDQAIALAEQAIKLANGSQLEELSVQGILGLGIAWSAQYRLEDVARMLKLAARQAESIRSYYLLAKVRYTLAQVMARLPEETSDIATLLDQAATYFRDHGMNAEWNEVLAFGSLIDTAAARYPEARKRSEAAQQWALQHGDRFQALVAELNIAEVEDHTGALGAAVARYKRIAADLESLGRRQGAVYALANGAMSAIRFGDLENARNMLQQARSVLREIAQSKPSAGVFLRIVEAEFALAENRYAEAEQFAREALARNKGGAQGRDILANGILARSLAASGRAAEGIALAERNVAEAVDAKQQFLIGEAYLRRLETLIHASRYGLAAKAARQLIAWSASRGHVPEQVEAMVLLSACEPSAVPDFKQIEQFWGKAELQRFLSRPDLQLLKKGLVRK